MPLREYPRPLSEGHPECSELSTARLLNNKVIRRHLPDGCTTRRRPGNGATDFKLHLRVGSVTVAIIE